MKINKIIQESQKKSQLQSTFPTWLHDELMRETNNFKRPPVTSSEDIELITNWVYAVNPKLYGVDIKQAYEQAFAWNRKEKAKSYPTHNVVYEFKDGWEIVKLSEQDIEIEKTLMQDEDNEFLKAYDSSYTYLADNDTIPKKEFQKETLVIFSLRDPNNMPQGTIEMVEEKNSRTLSVREIFAKEFTKTKVSQYHTDVKHSQATRIKEFFDYLKKKGYRFSPVSSEKEYGGSKITLRDLSSDNRDYAMQDDFGLDFDMYGIGGDADNYYKNIMEAYEEGWGGSQWYDRIPLRCFNVLLSYAEEREELNNIESAVQQFEEQAGKWWFESQDSSTMENPHPGDEPAPEDFMIKPDPRQMSLKGGPPPVPILNKEEYEIALQEYKTKLEAHEKEQEMMEKYFEPYVFGNYMYKAVQDAKKRTEQKNKQFEKIIKKSPLKIASSSEDIKIYKTADKKEDKKMPDGEAMELYIKTLKTYLKDNNQLDEKYADLIRKLPSGRKVRQEFSKQEIKVLYETIEYLWEKITGERIIPEKEIVRAPETLFGNYWMLNNGLLLKGLNHYSIVKQNPILFSSLLGIGGMTLQEYLASPPNKLIAFIIKNGGLRLFITKDKRLYAQMSPEIYGAWGKNKINKLDFKLKVVKVIDLSYPYDGWKSGIVIKL